MLATGDERPAASSPPADEPSTSAPAGGLGGRKTGGNARLRQRPAVAARHQHITMPRGSTPAATAIPAAPGSVQAQVEALLSPGKKRPQGAGAAVKQVGASGSSPSATQPLAELLAVVARAAEDPAAMRRLEALSRDQPDLYARLILEVFKSTKDFSVLSRMPPPAMPDLDFEPDFFGDGPGGFDYDYADDDDEEGGGGGHYLDPPGAGGGLWAIPPPDFDYVPDYDPFGDEGYDDDDGAWGEDEGGFYLDDDDEDANADGLFGEDDYRAFAERLLRGGGGGEDDDEGDGSSSGSWVTDDGQGEEEEEEGAAGEEGAQGGSSSGGVGGADAAGEQAPPAAAAVKQSEAGARPPPSPGRAGPAGDAADEATHAQEALQALRL